MGKTTGKPTKIKANKPPKAKAHKPPKPAKAPKAHKPPKVKSATKVKKAKDPKKAQQKAAKLTGRLTAKPMSEAQKIKTIGKIQKLLAVSAK